MFPSFRGSAIRLGGSQAQINIEVQECQAALIRQYSMLHGFYRSFTRKVSFPMASDAGFLVALDEARKGAAAGGVPIGACLVSAEGTILGAGHNQRVQKSSPTLHVCL